MVGTAAYDKLKLLLTKILLNDIKKLSPDAQTSCLEGFHATLNTWHPKLICYSWLGSFCSYVYVVLQWLPPKYVANNILSFSFYTLQFKFEMIIHISFWISEFLDEEYLIWMIMKRETLADRDAILISPATTQKRMS